MLSDGKNLQPVGLLFNDFCKFANEMDEQTTPKGLSILIPTYNNCCVNQVKDLYAQARQLTIPFEIIVADDGSTRHDTIEANEAINEMKGCRYIRRKPNVGRAAIRNFLAQEAQYPLLLFLDSGMGIGSETFLQTYLQQSFQGAVYGGYRVEGEAEQLHGNLRFRYEKAAESRFQANIRQQHPYRDFHTANFLIEKMVMCTHPFDERFRHYGYEDVLLGKELKRAGITITHIDNPVVFNEFESNASFVSKTEEGLRTLYQFQQELRGYSRLLTIVDGIHLKLVVWMIQGWHRCFGSLERRILCSQRPNLCIFSLYRLGYFLTYASK